MISNIAIGCTLLHSISFLSEIIHHAGWSVAVGIVIALAFVGLLFLLVRGFYPKSVFSPLSIVIGILLSIVLCFEFVPLCAAIALKGQISQFEVWLDENAIHPEDYAVPVPVTTEESTEIIERAVEEYPILGILIGSGEFTGFDTSNLAHAIASELNSYLNRLILKLVIVALVATSIGALLIVRTTGRKMDRRVRMRAQGRPSSGREIRPRGNPRLSGRRR